MSAQEPTTLVIGVGNPDRGDDGVGPLVASRMKRRADSRFRVIQQAGDGLSLMDAWEGADTVIILDAAFSGTSAGTIHRIDASVDLVPRDVLRCSTHALGVAEAIELARVLDPLPRRVIIYGIEGVNFEQGTGLTEAVEAASGKLEAMVSCDLETAART